MRLKPYMGAVVDHPKDQDSTKVSTNLELVLATDLNDAKNKLAALHSINRRNIGTKKIYCRLFEHEIDN